MSHVPSTLGQPAHYIHVIWLAAFATDPQEFYDELDVARWSLRCVRVYRDGTTKSFSWNSPNWRDVMPEAPIGEPDAINRDTQFRARAIARDEFEAVWEAAQPENPLRFNVWDSAGMVVCPCCGAPDQFSYAPYDARGGIIGSGICSCCYWEPGFDDDPRASEKAQATIKASLLAYRAAWIAADYPWKATQADRQAPPNWNGRTQYESLLRQFPRLA